MVKKIEKKAVMDKKFQSNGPGAPISKGVGDGGGFDEFDSSSPDQGQQEEEEEEEGTSGFDGASAFSAASTNFDAGNEK